MNSLNLLLLKVGPQTDVGKSHQRIKHTAIKNTLAFSAKSDTVFHYPVAIQFTMLSSLQG